jgi:hypothetical protein
MDENRIFAVGAAAGDVRGDEVEVVASDGCTDTEARAVLGRFESWLRCGPPGVLVIAGDVRPELADALRDVGRHAGVGEAEPAHV